MRLSFLCFLAILLPSSSAFGALRGRDHLTRETSKLLKWHQKKLLSAVTGGEKAKGVGGTQELGTHSNADECYWDEDRSQCLPTATVAADLVRKSGKAYGQLVADYLDCSGASDESTCEVVGKCSWDKESDFCNFVAFDEWQKESPCGVAAPATIQLLSEGGRCPLLDSTSCSDKAECSWDADQDMCELDMFRVYFDFSVDDIEAALTTSSSPMAKLFQQEFDMLDPEFKPESILDWKVPETPCLERTSEMLCDFSRAVVAHIFPIAFYCGLKHASIFSFWACKADPLCEFDLGSFSCGAERSQTPAAWGKGYEVLSSFLDHAVDRQFIGISGKCLQNPSEDMCSGDCAWEEDDDGYGLCAMSASTLERILAEPGKGGSDTLCLLFDAFASNDCNERDSIQSCHASKECMWTNAGCDVSYGYLVSTVAKVDHTVEGPYTELEDQCSKHETSEACSGSSSSDLSFS